MTYLLLYMDDSILTASGAIILCRLIVSLIIEFSMACLRESNYFLGISVNQLGAGMFLSQNYASNILQHANMSQCNPCHTWVESTAKLGGSG